jgi:hypothetical protein
MTNLDEAIKEDTIELLLTYPARYGFFLYAIASDKETSIKYEKKIAIPEEQLEEFKKHHLWDKVKDEVVLIKKIETKKE